MSPDQHSLQAQRPPALCSAVTLQQRVWAEMLPAFLVGTVLVSPSSKDFLSFCQCLPQFSLPYFPVHMYSWGFSARTPRSPESREFPEPSNPDWPGSSVQPRILDPVQHTDWSEARNPWQEGGSECREQFSLKDYTTAGLKSQLWNGVCLAQPQLPFPVSVLSSLRASRPASSLAPPLTVTRRRLPLLLDPAVHNHHCRTRPHPPPASAKALQHQPFFQLPWAGSTVPAHSKYLGHCIKVCFTLHWNSPIPERIQCFSFLITGTWESGR